MNYIRLGVGRCRINSLGRTEAYNATLKNSSSVSQHLIWNKRPVRAVDLHALDISQQQFENWVDKNISALKLLGVRGIGFYGSFIHFDVRKQKKVSTWGGVSSEQRQRWNKNKFLIF